MEISFLARTRAATPKSDETPSFSLLSLRQPIFKNKGRSIKKSPLSITSFDKLKREKSSSRRWRSENAHVYIWGTEKGKGGKGAIIH